MKPNDHQSGWPDFRQRLGWWLKWGGRLSATLSVTSIAFRLVDIGPSPLFHALLSGWRHLANALFGWLTLNLHFPEGTQDFLLAYSIMTAIILRAIVGFEKAWIDIIADTFETILPKNFSLRLMIGALSGISIMLFIRFFAIPGSPKDWGPITILMIIPMAIFMALGLIFIFPILCWPIYTLRSFYSKDAKSRDHQFAVSIRNETAILCIGVLILLG